MDVRATKDHYENETEETERLVRPSPKVKPPRHDKMREDVHERDPDTDGDPDLKGDPDMSVNYKDVGGSLVERVVARFATKPKDEQDKPKSNKWVRVKNKVLDVGTRVRPDTLIEEPGLYQKQPKNEPRKDENKPRPARKPERPYFHKDPIPHQPWPDPRPMPPKPPRPVRPPKQVKPVPVRRYPEPETMPMPKPPGWVPERRKPASVVVARFLQAKEFPTEEALKEYLKDHPLADPKEHSFKKPEEAKPKGEEAPALAKARSVPKPKAPKEKKPKKEDTILEGVVPEEKPKEEAKTEAPKAEKLKPAKIPKPPKRESYDTDDEFAAAQEKHKEIVEKARPELEQKANAPKPKRETFESEEEFEKALSTHKKEQAEAKAALGQADAKGPQPKRRKPSKEEVAAMEQDIASSFPLSVGSKLLAANLHPDDYQQIKASAAVAAQVPLSMDKLDERLEELKKLPGGDDPSKVPPPKQAKDRAGNMVPFESLPKEEQAEAWAQFRNEVVAAHIGVRAQVATTYRKAGMPESLSRALTQSKFGEVSPESVWDKVLEAGTPDKLNPKARAKLLDKLTSDKERALATRYFQGQDYLNVRDQFLNPSSENGISEFSSSKDIRKALQMGSAMLDEQAKSYPAELRDSAVASQFRWRVLRKLEALDPHKATIVQKAVDEMDAEDYDRSKKDWLKQDMQAKHLQAKRDAQREKIQEQFEQDQKDAEGGYREAPKPVKTVEERLKEKDLEPERDPVPPVPPKKPARYDLVRGNVPKAKDQHKDLFEQVEEPAIELKDEDIEVVEPKRPSKPPPKPKRTKQAALDDLSCRVVGRFLAFSTCTG